MEPEYEPDTPFHWCMNCEHYAHDEWYPGEQICICPYSDHYDNRVSDTDTCDHWELSTDWEGDA